VTGDYRESMKESIRDYARSRSGFSSRLAIGLFIIALGVVFTLDNLGVIEGHSLLRYWPVFFVLVGTVRLIGARGVSQVISGLFWLFVGTWALLHELGVVSISIWRLWPVWLIVVGLNMIVRRPGGNRSWGKMGIRDTNDDSRVKVIAIMAGVDRKLTSQAFSGGDATALMGGVTLDLRQAQMEGGRAEIDVFAFWGGIELYVPLDWMVRIDATPIMGGVEDSRRGVTADPNKTLVLRGGVLMGGIEIKN
jgi:predicted membrane protein